MDLLNRVQETDIVKIMNKLPANEATRLTSTNKSLVNLATYWKSCVIYRKESTLIYLEDNNAVFIGEDRKHKIKPNPDDQAQYYLEKLIVGIVNEFDYENLAKKLPKNMRCKNLVIRGYNPWFDLRAADVDFLFKFFKARDLQLQRISVVGEINSKPILAQISKNALSQREVFAHLSIFPDAPYLYLDVMGIPLLEDVIEYWKRGNCRAQKWIRLRLFRTGRTGANGILDHETLISEFNSFLTAFPHTEIEEKLPIETNIDTIFRIRITPDEGKHAVVLFSEPVKNLNIFDLKECIVDILPNYSEHNNYDLAIVGDLPR